jgi:hypothetical protein
MSEKISVLGRGWSGGFASNSRRRHGEEGVPGQTQELDYEWKTRNLWVVSFVGRHHEIIVVTSRSSDDEIVACGDKIIVVWN